MAGDRQSYNDCERGCTCRECLPLPKAERRAEIQARAAECLAENGKECPRGCGHVLRQL